MKYQGIVDKVKKNGGGGGVAAIDSPMPSHYGISLLNGT